MGWINIDASKRIYNSKNVIYKNIAGKHTIMYFIVVNVLTSEVVYREIDQQSKNVTIDRLETSIYNTLFYFYNNINGKKVKDD
jgi:hypothetical protein